MITSRIVRAVQTLFRVMAQCYRFPRWNSRSVLRHGTTGKVMPPCSARALFAEALPPRRFLAFSRSVSGLRCRNDFLRYLDQVVASVLSVKGLQAFQ